MKQAKEVDAKTEYQYSIFGIPYSFGGSRWDSGELADYPAQAADQILFLCGEAVIVPPDQQVTVAVARTAAGFLNQAEGFQNFEGNGGVPHIGTGDPAQELQLACAVINGKGAVWDTGRVRLLGALKGEIRERAVPEGSQHIGP